MKPERPTSFFMWWIFPHPEFEDHINVVNETLAEIGARDKPTILVFNKIDAYSHVKKDEDDLTPVTKENWSLDDLKKSWMSQMVMIASSFLVAKKQNIDELRDLFYERVKAIHITRGIRTISCCINQSASKPFLRLWRRLLQCVLRFGEGFLQCQW